MKYFAILVLTFSTLLANKDLLSYVEDINKINETILKVLQESATDTKSVQKLYDPFYNKPKQKVIKKEEIKQKKVTKITKSNKNRISLTMILNQKAFINGKWYKVNDKLDDYVINKIDQDIVVLNKNRKYTTLKLEKTDSILIVTQEIK